MLTLVAALRSKSKPLLVESWVKVVEVCSERRETNLARERFYYVQIT